MAEGEIEQTVQALEMAKLRLENMAKEAELLQMSLSEHVRAIETIRACSGLGEGKEILVPVGASTFLPAKTSGTGIAIVGIGAGVSAERTFDEAIAGLEKDAAEIELEERKLLQEMKNLEKQAAFLSQRVQAYQQEQEGGVAEGAVKVVPRKTDEEE